MLGSGAWRDIRKGESYDIQSGAIHLSYTNGEAVMVDCNIDVWMR